MFKPAVGAGLAVLCGLALWKLPLGERWVSGSYDYLFRFGARSATNQVVLVLMDNEAYGHYTSEARGKPWSRALHARLLNRLADDGCAMVIFDTFFRIPREPESDQALAEAMGRQRKVVLMAEQAESEHQKPGQHLESARPVLPADLFLSATNTNWGVAWLDKFKDLDSIIRSHWPFPSPGPYPSLPWTAATTAGARLSEEPCERWLRYYGERGQWTRLSYHFAFGQAPNYFRDKIVFIGSKPESSAPDDEEDEFRTPYTRWTGESSGGVEIQATAFLNLLNNEWLQRPAGWLEALVFIVTGVVLGGWLGRFSPLAASGIAIGTSVIVTLGGVSLSYLTNIWFPWLVIAGGQVPCALAWTLAASSIRYPVKEAVEVIVPKPLPAAADYELVDPPFGHGAYGRVWLARNAVGQWQALKAVYQDLFGQNTEPFERELRGIERYKPISDKHPGLLRVDFVSRRKPEGYFYYVMELGDAQTPGWEKNPASYKPRDLASVRAQAEKGRLPVRECVRIGIALADALKFLHEHELTHRDIKPQNIVFVNGQPKLADVGLVTEVLPAGQEHTWVGTPGYMPPLPEPPGTPQADIYGLGMVLYVISTGHDPVSFPELSTTMVGQTGQQDFIRLNALILKACQPDRAQRFASAAEMHVALLELQKVLAGESPEGAGTLCSGKPA